MNVGLNDWDSAQNLLISLARALSEKIDTEELSSRYKGTDLIAERIFRNSYTSSKDKLIYRTRLLPALQTAKSQMEHWIENLSFESYQNSEPVFSTKNQTQEKKIAKIETSFLSKSLQSGTQGLFTKLYEKRADTEKFVMQAQRLIDEVRIAIHTLSSSSYLRNPQPDPLRNILIKLQPLVNECVDTLSKSNLDRGDLGVMLKNQSLLKSTVVNDRVSICITEKSIPHASKSVAISPSLPTQSTNLTYSFLNQRRETDSKDDAKNSENKNPLDSNFSNEKKRVVETKVHSKTERSQTEQDHSIISTSETPKCTLLSQNPDQEIGDQNNNSHSFSDVTSNSQTEKTPLLQDHSNHPICLPNTVSFLNQLFQKEVKKKKKRRYFFQNQSLDDFRDHSEE